MKALFLLAAILAATAFGDAALVIGQLLVLEALVISITSFIAGVFKIPEGAWNGWARILLSWAVAIALCFGCYYLAPYSKLIPELNILFEPAWASLIVEGVLLGALANKLVDKTFAEKIAEFIENLFNKK